MKQCLTCNKQGTKLKCSVCEGARYCNRDCQLSHWKTHKADCYNTANETNKVVYHLLTTYRSEFFSQIPPAHCAIWLQFDSLSVLHEAQAGIFRNCRINEKVPASWSKLMPLAMVNTDPAQHIVVCLHVKKAAKTDEFYDFAFAVGRDPAHDTMVANVLDLQSGSMMFTMNRKYENRNAPTIVVSSVY